MHSQVLEAFKIARRMTSNLGIDISRVIMIWLVVHAMEQFQLLFFVWGSLSPRILKLFHVHEPLAESSR